MKKLTIATRGSKLALTQAELVKAALLPYVEEVEFLEITTKGDQDRTSALINIGGDGLFVRGVELAVLEGRADFAVHCGKDLPYEILDSMTIAAVPKAEDARDLLILRRDLATNAPVIGTGSPRRVAELARILPNASTKGIRGNITTRLRKLQEGEYDGIILAAAGVNRLGLDVSGFDVRPLEVSEMIPAACQGILACECLTDNQEVRDLLKHLTDGPSEERFRIERGIFKQLRADCTKPVGIHAEVSETTICLDAVCDGVRIHLEADKADETNLIAEAVKALTERKGESI